MSGINNLHRTYPELLDIVESQNDRVRTKSYCRKDKTNCASWISYATERTEVRQKLLSATTTVSIAI